jgi:hypothetical protein
MGSWRGRDAFQKRIGLWSMGGNCRNKSGRLASLARPGRLAGWRLDAWRIGKAGGDRQLATIDPARKSCHPIPPFPHKTRKGWGTLTVFCCRNKSGRLASLARPGRFAGWRLDARRIGKAGGDRQLATIDPARKSCHPIPPFPHRTRKGWGTLTVFCCRNKSGRLASLARPGRFAGWRLDAWRLGSAGGADH